MSRGHVTAVWARSPVPSGCRSIGVRTHRAAAALIATNWKRSRASHATAVISPQVAPCLCRRGLTLRPRLCRHRRPEGAWKANVTRPPCAVGAVRPGEADWLLPVRSPAMARGAALHHVRAPLQRAYASAGIDAAVPLPSALAQPTCTAQKPYCILPHELARCGSRRAPCLPLHSPPP